MTAALEPLANLIRRHYLFADRAESLAQQVEDWATGTIAELESAEEVATALTWIHRFGWGVVGSRPPERPPELGFC